MDKQTFREQYSEDPKREDLTVLVPKQDDPTEQVAALIGCWLILIFCPCVHDRQLVPAMHNEPAACVSLLA